MKLVNESVALFWGCKPVRSATPNRRQQPERQHQSPCLLLPRGTAPCMNRVRKVVGLGDGKVAKKMEHVPANVKIVVGTFV